MTCRTLLTSEPDHLTGHTKYQAYCPVCLWESAYYPFRWQAARAAENHTGQSP